MQVQLRFFDKEPSIQATVEIDYEQFGIEGPPQQLRGRILAIGEYSILEDFRIQPGCHTFSFANDCHRYYFKMVQAGALWFTAEMKRQPRGWASRIKQKLRF